MLPEELQIKFNDHRIPMADTNQKQLGSTLWNIADPLCGAMDADDFRDTMRFLPAESNLIIFVVPRK